MIAYSATRSRRCWLTSVPSGARRTPNQEMSWAAYSVRLPSRTPLNHASTILPSPTLITACENRQPSNVASAYAGAPGIAIRP